MANIIKCVVRVLPAVIQLILANVKPNHQKYAKGEKIVMTQVNNVSLSYRDAGVDIDAGNQAVEEIKSLVKKTYRPEVLGDLGGFGGLFALDTRQYNKPVLVAGTDGVGTKLQIAFMLNQHQSIGQDVVAMCANDILAQGAEPLFFLDYLAVGKLHPLQIKQFVAVMVTAC